MTKQKTIKQDAKQSEKASSTKKLLLNLSYSFLMTLSLILLITQSIHALSTNTIYDKAVDSSSFAKGAVALVFSTLSLIVSGVGLFFTNFTNININKRMNIVILLMIGIFLTISFAAPIKNQYDTRYELAQQEILFKTINPILTDIDKQKLHLISGDARSVGTIDLFLNQFSHLGIVDGIRDNALKASLKGITDADKIKTTTDAFMKAWNQNVAASLLNALTTDVALPGGTVKAYQISLPMISKDFTNMFNSGILDAKRHIYVVNVAAYSACISLSIASMTLYTIKG